MKYRVLLAATLFIASVTSGIAEQADGVGHPTFLSPHAGPIAFVSDGDRIRLDMAARTLDLLVPPEQIEERRADWKPREPRYTTGVLGKYARLVGSAARGAVCD